MGTGITLQLKKDSKKFWPRFPSQVGFFTIASYQHAKKEVLPLNELKLATIPVRAYDPSQVDQNVSNETFIGNYTHEHN